MNKFWNKPEPNKFWGRNSPAPLHDVTHRAIGDVPGCTMLPANEQYVGVFPSPETCAFVNEMKTKMKFFDDGHRMVYNKPEGRTVPVEPCDVKHPIAYAPSAFKLQQAADGEFQWVLK